MFIREVQKMRARWIFGAVALLAYCPLSACEFKSNELGATPEAGGASVSAGGANAGRGGRSGNGGAAGSKIGGREGVDGAGDASAAGDAGFTSGGTQSMDDPSDDLAGARGDAGSGANSSGGGATEIMPDCVADGGCAAAPLCLAASATCSVELVGPTCEIASFVGSSAPVACGEAATVGTVECGACGRVAVEVYFDGTQCWEGMPDCPLPDYLGKFFGPHPP